LALRDEIGCCRSVVIALERVWYPRTAEFEIDSAHNEFAVRLGEPQIEHFDRIKRLRGIVVPETRGWLAQRNGGFIHLSSPKIAGESHRD
jgi:hypothetical protein